MICHKKSESFASKHFKIIIDLGLAEIIIGVHRKQTNGIRLN